MIGSSSRAWTIALLSSLGVVACGLRSDPFATSDTFIIDDDDGSDTEEPGDPNRPGTCNSPLDLPFSSEMILRGELSGPSFQEGWCGSDGGPEDVYLMSPDYDVDVIISMIPGETDFRPTLRVIENGCGVGQGFTRVCTRNVIEDPYHFLARAGNVYSVIIDSPEGTEGRYGFEVVYDWPPLELCNVHPEDIEQLPGSAFIWNNDFSQGQGRVDGYCGGPGRENMFRLISNYPGNMYAQVQATGGFAPVISLRTSCAALSELSCSADAPGGFTDLSYFIEPGVEYFLVVDQGEIGQGSYELRVDFE